MTPEILILNLKGKGMKELHIESADHRPLTRQWLEDILVKNGGKIFKYNERIRIGVGDAFGSCVRLWVHNGREFFMAYCTDDIEVFLKKFDRIIKAVTSPHYFIIAKKTEIFYLNGTISIPAPVVEYPFIDGVGTKDTHKN